VLVRIIFSLHSAGNGLEDHVTSQAVIGLPLTPEIWGWSVWNLWWTRWLCPPSTVGFSLYHSTNLHDQLFIYHSHNKIFVN